MNSRQRVLTVFAHEEPDRVPIWCGCSPEFLEKAKRQLGIADDEALRQRFGDDFRRVSASYVGPKSQLHGDATMRTIFGVERHGIGYGQPTSIPLAEAETVRDVHDYAWPDPNWMDVGGIRSVLAAYNGEYAILGGDWSPFWHDAILPRHGSEIAEAPVRRTDSVQRRNRLASCPYRWDCGNSS